MCLFIHTSLSVKRCISVLFILTSLCLSRDVSLSVNSYISMTVQRCISVCLFIHLCLPIDVSVCKSTCLFNSWANPSVWPSTYLYLSVIPPVYVNSPLSCLRKWLYLNKIDWNEKRFRKYYLLQNLVELRNIFRTKLFCRVNPNGAACFSDFYWLQKAPLKRYHNL